MILDDTATAQDNGAAVGTQHAGVLESWSSPGLDDRGDGDADPGATSLDAACDGSRDAMTGGTLAADSAGGGAFASDDLGLGALSSGGLLEQMARFGSNLNVGAANPGNAGGTLAPTGASGGATFGAGAGPDQGRNGPALDAVTVANGVLDFLGAGNQQLWFQQVGSDLQIALMGTTEQVTVGNWFAGVGRGDVQSFAAADGSKLDTQTAQLVSAMATYSADNRGFDPAQASQVPNDPTLQGALAAAWHS